MELLISLLFFAIAGAVCLSLFVSAHNTNELSSDLSHASILLNNYCETIYGNNSVAMEDELRYYDSSLNQCSAESASYCLKTKVETQDHITNIQIVISDSEQNKDLITHEIKKYERRVLRDITKE